MKNLQRCALSIHQTDKIKWLPWIFWVRFTSSTKVFPSFILSNSLSLWPINIRIYSKISFSLQEGNFLLLEHLLLVYCLAGVTILCRVVPAWGARLKWNSYTTEPLLLLVRSSQFFITSSLVFITSSYK